MATVMDAEERQQIIGVLNALLALPMILASAVKGKALRPLLAEVTGLSETRIAQGNLDALSAATQRRITAHTREYALEEGRRIGLTSKEVESWILELQDFGSEPWELFAVLLMVRESGRIPYARSFGRHYGSQLRALLDDVKADRFDAFREKLSSKAVCDVLDQLDTTSVGRLEGYRIAFEAATSWETARPLMREAVDLWMLNFFAAMDAEWGTLFFGAMRPAPYFLWVAPMASLAVHGEPERKTRRNIVYRPVRRLLQFSHALMERKCLGAWPSQPVGRVAFGRDSDRTQEWIGNYFDGTKILRKGDYLQMWSEMYQRLSGENSDDDSPTPPMALMHVALLWESLLVMKRPGMKLDAFIILDEALYRACWRRHLSDLAGQPSGRVHDWPEWMINQSLSSSSTDSCQS
jgi:hypothetical protein